MMASFEAETSGKPPSIGYGSHLPPSSPAHRNMPDQRGSPRRGYYDSNTPLDPYKSPPPQSPKHSGGEGYQYTPFKSSVSSSQLSLSQKSQGGQYSSYTPPEMVGGHSSKGQLPGFAPRPERPQSSMQPQPQRGITRGSHSAYGEMGKPKREDHSHNCHLSVQSLDDRVARSSSLKNDRFNYVDQFEEFSDAQCQFKNCTGTPAGGPWRRSTSSSDSSLQEESPQHSIHSSPGHTPLYHGHQQHYRHSQGYGSPAHSNGRHYQQPELLLEEEAFEEPIHMDLHEVQLSKARHLAERNGSMQQQQHHQQPRQQQQEYHQQQQQCHQQQQQHHQQQHQHQQQQQQQQQQHHQQQQHRDGSGRHHSVNGHINNGVYRSSSRHTYVESRTVASRRVNSNDSFSFASSIKCCVGMQTKKKRAPPQGGGGGGGSGPISLTLS